VFSVFRTNIIDIRQDYTMSPVVSTLLQTGFFIVNQGLVILVALLTF